VVFRQGLVVFRQGRVVFRQGLVRPGRPSLQVWIVPELVEVERYRLLAEAAGLSRSIEAVDAPDAWYLKGGLDSPAVSAALVGQRFVSARRRGKLLLLDTDTGPTLGLRFGMSGRLLVDGVAAVDRLIHAPAAGPDRFCRFAVLFAGGGRLEMSDPRRLGGVELDPEEGRLGPDALGIGPAALRRALAGTPVAVKARLLDQTRIAGVGNLIADEALWRAGVAPGRPCSDLSPADVARLHRHLRAAVADLLARGGSSSGELMPERRPGGRCPRDAEPLVRATIGGRTTWWCPRHQR
jgi:formamidopyrimidine-DNA glycosylase